MQSAKRRKVSAVAVKAEPQPAGEAKGERWDLSRQYLMWFRGSDLRVQDNTALHESALAARNDKCGLVALFLITPEEWKDHQWGATKLDFTLRNVRALQKRLEELNIPLIIKETKPSAGRRGHIAAAAEAVAEVVSHPALNVSRIYCNIQYEVNEGERDTLLEQQLAARAPPITLHRFHDQCVVQPGTLRAKSSNAAYKVYTPFKNAWLNLVKEHQGKGYPQDYLFVRPVPAAWPADNAELIRNAVKEEKKVPLQDAMPESVFAVRGYAALEQEAASGCTNKVLVERVAERWVAGEAEAGRRLRQFCVNRMKDYADKRNEASLDGTSSMSAYLASGVLSARQCVEEVMRANNNRMDTGSEGAKVWIQEIIWREFYRSILYEFPRVCRGKPFQLMTDRLPWRYDDDDFKRWCEGRTGYPFVDAGMRQLNTTGWMHNRLRMVVAMFLSKHLLLDWRLGERYFMSKLVDGDLASNNGGWQWASSTGTDAQPYFRIFAPVTQGVRFDATGAYVRRYVPELKGLNNKAIHEPWTHLSTWQLAALGYPQPVVKHETGRARALAAFTAVFKGSSRNPPPEDEEQKHAAPAAAAAVKDEEDPAPRPKPSGQRQPAKKRKAESLANASVGMPSLESMFEQNAARAARIEKRSAAR